MFLKSLHILIFLLVCLAILAEADESDKSEALKITKNWTLGSFVDFPTYSFYFGAPDINGQAYVPNFSPRLGVRFKYQRLSMRTSYSLPLPDYEVRRRGYSEQTNYLANYYSDKFSLDMYYQYFKGFYLGSPVTELNIQKPERYSQLPEAHSRHWGINFYYEISDNKFNFISAFDKTNSTLEDGYAWVIIPFYRYWKISLGEQILKGSDSNALDVLPALRSGDFYTLGASIAYAKTWLYKKAYLSVLAGAGPALQKQSYIENNLQKESTTYAGKANFNFSIGIKPEDYIIGSSLMLDSIYSKVANNDTYSALASIEFFLNRRF